MPVGVYIRTPEMKKKRMGNTWGFKKGCIPFNKGLSGSEWGGFEKGYTPWNKDKEIGPHSEEWRKKISESNSGEKHWNWQNGKSFEPYPLGWTKTFKEQIRRRDEYKCQNCGVPETETGRKSDVHHIDYIKENLNPINLISLCKKCHGRTYTNRHHWIKYYQELISRYQAA